MKIELSARQEQAANEGRPVEVVDPKTQRRYVLIAPEHYERMQATPSAQPTPPGTRIPPEVRMSQEAYWQDLPELLTRRSDDRRWVAYCGTERIGFGKTMAELYEVCERRGLRSDQFYVDRLEPRAWPPWEEEIIEAQFDTEEPPSPAS